MSAGFTSQRWKKFSFPGDKSWLQGRARLVCMFATVVLTSVWSSPAWATEWFVAAGAMSGTGTSAAPFGRIQDGISAARAGDTVTVSSGVYAESLRTLRAGTATQPIRVRAAGPRGSVTVTTPATVLRVDHAYWVFEGLVLDGQYAAFDTVDVNGGANFLTLRNVEVRRSTKDLIDMGGPQGVLIENCLIHHALNAAGGRTDAHGIVAGAVQDLTVRNTEIHTFSGDGIQVDPGRTLPGWSRVTIEGSHIWLAPLPAATNGFAKGAVPGENAVDTKANVAAPRATIVIRDTVASGFRGGLISNMAAFNLKENVDATVERVTVFDSEIAFRLRGPTSPTTPGAWVTVKNAVVYNTAVAYRYENNIEQLRVWNSTLGRGVTQAFRAAQSSLIGLEVRNLLMMGTKPAEATHPSNLSVGTAAFVNAGADNYQLAAGSPAIDAGIMLADVKTDRLDRARPQGGAFDVGAYEYGATAGAPGTPGTPGTPPPIGSSVGDIVVHAWKAIASGGAWQRVADATAAGGWRMWHPNAGRLFALVANPVEFFDVIVPVEGRKKYRLWIRGKADGNSPANDSVFVQFSGAIDGRALPTWAIGTASGTTVSLEDCNGCGLAGWGWQDNKSGIGALGTTVVFGKTGSERIRIQTREDGISVDQIVLSPSTYRSNPPGATKNDQTILQESN